LVAIIQAAEKYLARRSITAAASMRRLKPALKKYGSYRSGVPLRPITLNPEAPALRRRSATSTFSAGCIECMRYFHICCLDA